MNPKNGAYTVVMPWYEREDFERLLELADDRKDFNPDYDLWHATATRVAQEYLRNGKALELIVVRPDRLLAWLAMRNEPNNAAARLRFVEAVAVQQISREATFDRGGVNFTETQDEP